MQIRVWLRAAIARLSSSESPKRDAEILLAWVSGKSRAWLIAFDDAQLDDSQLAALESLLARRAAGEPVAYLIGEREFWSLPLSVSPDTLIPRPDSEVLVEQALSRLPADPCAILDLGTGTGAIALALASERADCQVTGVDRIAAAVALATHNGAKLNLPNARFLQSDWFSALNAQRFQLIVSNPPYIDAADHHLSQGDVRFEPASALVASDHGLADIKTIASSAAKYLADNGWLLLEHGWQQGEAVRQILRENSFCQVETCQDYGGNDRVTLGQITHN
ncbi:SAM-dependent methyltransferase [bacteria symbiont BFo1 of Frankliniella occidentalis]|uniref:peptide chain release factor N(5)-glutamine methyltransferase n=1 Tax=Erwinia aphidicola TaxID=68334 RepID=UPI000664604B|nr:peptide chain release factor N(5)-glutamine methyltransferase [Erwinia aphidicola]KMV70333.1 SAM-dependent methyltransferase [bacteria symbiont BFo1 of Frankliniella occidentalis]KYP84815.1 SAM-dependent methyltransferase [bacteria symbiont BFo1 of Frankliniella occidentalis]KYP89873.1 SAM-dependent methyltransferase [bacteria symbiont BFo1 of Frankliniella occidentalis]MBD1377043.1 peptide chain release factor N(5)-glutamine methyltransferase [Erwinia aphidicola]MBD1377583.1 peptide chain 